MNIISLSIFRWFSDQKRRRGTDVSSDQNDASKTRRQWRENASNDVFDRGKKRRERSFHA